MTKILNLEAVKSSSNLRSLRKLYDELEISIRNLETMQVTSGSYGHLLIPILLKLLPEDLVLEFNRCKKSEDDINVTELINFLKREIDVREASALVLDERKNVSDSRFNRPKFENRGYVRNAPTATALNTQVKNICIFCPGYNNHDSFKCFKDVQEKLNKLRAEKRCQICFKRYHFSRNCRMNWNSCTICKNNNHHESICLNKNRQAFKRNVKGQEQNSPENSKVSQISANNNENEILNSINSQPKNSEIVNAISQCNLGNSNSKKVLLQTCTVLACSKEKTKQTRIILDNGSEKSFISKDLANYLKLKPVRYENLSIYSFGIKNASEKTYPVVQLELKKNKNKIKVELLVTDILTSAPIRHLSQNIINLMQGFRLEIGDESFTQGEKHLMSVEILLGSDLFWNIVANERFKINDSLIAIKTMFGFVVAGTEYCSINECTQNITIVNNALIMNDINVFWDLDSMGINSKSDKISDRDIDIINKFEKNLLFKNGRYETKLIWKSSPELLDSNFEIAKKRFNVLSNKLNENKTVGKEYKEIVDEQVKLGIVELCSKKIQQNNEYYMPHTAIIRDYKETSRVRIVFDASSKAENKKSLNDFLEAGPNLNPKVLDIILKFREHEISFCGDIEKAFLMVGISESDRKYLKFIWFNDNENDSFKIMQMTRAPFGVKCSPFILAATIKYHLKKYETENNDSFQMLNSSLYVDDLFHGADNLENAYRLSCDAVTILGSAGMKLRKLQTNSSELKELWIKNKFDISDSLNESKILGMIWLPDEDILKLDITALIESLDGIKDTKRHVLKTVSKIYDPTCMAAPFVIRIKILMQNIWQRGLDWDDELPQDLKIKWRQWCSEIHHLSDFYIKRNFFLNVNKSDKKVILHVFADASPKAYGSVAYVQYLDEENKFSTNFIISKTRVSPLKLLTLPRLELMAAVVAARLGKYLLELFPHLFKEVYYWTDSEIVIHWLKGDYSLWKPFISNRVAEVHLLSNPMSWRHCSGKNNPADLVTKGLDSISLKSCSLWQHGPEWLKKSCDHWPEQKINSVNKEDLEYRSSVLVNNNIVQNEDVIDISRFSNLKRLLRVSAWIKRFINRIRKLPTESGPLTALEIENAEIFWIRKVQSEVYASEIQTLEKKMTVSAESSIYSLAPYLDDQGIIRIKGRLEESQCTFEEKSPIILPKISKFTELLVQHEHFKVLHSGVAVTLTRIRKKYWIPKGRQLVKKIIGRCLICSKYAVKPANQLTAQIPKDRISEIPAFSIVGLDFTGPVMVRNGKDVQKAYIALFTCAVTRAVHLELVSDMSSKKFLLSFRRFVSRRGNCRIIYSDNAKSFKAADRDLNYFYKLIIKDTEIKDFIASERITWKFIVELAPWWGGFYERLMKSIKEPLKKILGKALLTFEEMLTILTEIEVVLNQRPLTYNYNDHNEPVPLTPSNFLHFGRKSFAYPCNFAELVNKASSKEALTKRKLYQTKLLKQLWLKWKDLYLLNLRTAHHFVTPVSQTNLKVNDVVIVEGNTKNKLLWDLGLIHEVILGRDGNVRACVVKTAKGQYKRPIQVLYPLEISDDNKT